MKGGGHGHVCSPDDLSATNWQTTHGSIVFPCAHVLDELCSRVGRKEPKKSSNGLVATCYDVQDLENKDANSPTP